MIPGIQYPYANSGYSYQPRKRRQAVSARSTRNRPSRTGYRTVARTRGPLGFGDTKYFDAQKTNTNIVTDNSWVGSEIVPPGNTLFYPTVGSAINQRIGRTVHVHCIRIKGVMRVAPQTNQTAADQTALIRVLLVQDNQTNGTQTQGENVLEGGSDQYTGVQSFQNIDSLGRYKVLKDKSWSLGNPNAVYDGTNVETMGIQRAFKWSIKFRKPLVVHFNETNGGSVADIVDKNWTILANSTNQDLSPTRS